MKWFIFIVIFFQGVLVSGIVDKVNINGVDIPIVYEEYRGLPIVSFQLIVKNAGSHEDKDKAGISRFTSSVLSEGSLAKGSIKFAEELEKRAIHLSAHSGGETMVFDLSSLREEFDFGITMLKELLDDPNLSKESFLKIKQLTLGELSSKKSDFDYIANLNLKKLIFNGTPLGVPSIGDEQSIDSLKLDDLKEFYKTHVDLSNSLVVVGGDISLDEVKESLKKLLKDIPVGTARVLKSYVANGDKKENTLVKETEQAYIYFGAPYDIVSGDVDIYKSKVAGFILGESGFGSRLMEEIRVKRGLAYSAYSRNSINRSYSYFSGHLQTKNENLKESVELVKSEIKRFVDGGVTEEELAQAKRFLLGSEPLRNETLSQRLNRAFFEYYHGVGIGYSKLELEKIENLSLKDLNEFIKKHDEINNLSFSVVTNQSEQK